MGIEIDLSGAEIGGNVDLLNHTTVKGSNDVRIDLHSSKISGQANVLEKLEISSVLNTLEDRSAFMDRNSDEYMEIQKLLKVKNWNDHDLIKRITKHLGEFSQGVLASIVANLIT